MVNTIFSRMIIWRFPKMGIPPNDQFYFRIFHYIVNPSIFGYPPFLETIYGKLGTTISNMVYSFLFQIYIYKHYHFGNPQPLRQSHPLSPEHPWKAVQGPEHSSARPERFLQLVDEATGGRGKSMETPWVPWVWSHVWGPLEWEISDLGIS
jgi:hypothetical protein